MANHKSAEKRIRQTHKRTARNVTRRSRIRTYIRKVEEAIESGDKDAADAALKAAMPEIAKGAGRGLMPKARASRKISRLARRVNAVGA